jgi:hypothetical protein
MNSEGHKTMSEMETYRDIIANRDSVTSHVSAMQVIDAYHELRKLNSEELDVFCFEYARTGIENKLLKNAFEDHLWFCEECKHILTPYKAMFEAIDQYGNEVVAEAKVKVAEKLFNEGKPEAAVKVLHEALEFRPRDEETRNKILEIKRSIISVTFERTSLDLQNALAQLFRGLYENAKETLKGPGECAILGIPAWTTGRVLGDAQLEGRKMEEPSWDSVLQGRQAVQLKLGHHVLQAIRVPENKIWVFTRQYKGQQMPIAQIDLTRKHKGRFKSERLLPDEHGQTIVTDDIIDGFVGKSSTTFTICLEKP